MSFLNKIKGSGQDRNSSASTQAVNQHDGSFDHVDQFAHVAGPAIALEPVERGLVELLGRKPLAFGLRKEVADEIGHILDPFARRGVEHRDLVVAAFGIVIVIDGQIVGVWNRVIEKDRVLLTLEPFRALSEAEQQALDLVVQRYGAFLGKPIILAETSASNA